MLTFLLNSKNKNIDAFDFKAQPSINEQLVQELMRGEYIDKRENVFRIGNSGTGKTHLASALAFSACAHGRKVRFHTVTGLITALVECREERHRCNGCKNSYNGFTCSS